jgi:hypothetical protein
VKTWKYWTIREHLCRKMAVSLPGWLTRACDEIRRLADCPWTLFFILLAMNAIARPCSITAHDARLYSLQALNQAEDGAYAGDVFLHYGSQDQFTFFARVAGPMVATMGLRPAFFVLYLIFNTLFVFALFRLVRALIDDTLISTLALIFLVTAPLNYGGYDIFTVHEQFFTPRIIGTTLTLFALERMLRQHFTAALVLLVAGAVMHPLMAFGGLMVWAGFVACTYLPRPVLVGMLVVGLIGGVLVLGIPALGTRLFGTMDDDWHQIIRIAVGYNYPDTWPLKDWINLAVSFVVPIAACFSLYRDDPVRRRFFIIIILASAVGFGVTVAASMLPYALLFQGQPYRVLWILKVLQAPVGFLLIARWSQSSGLYANVAALALLAFFCVIHYIGQELLIFALAVPLSVVVSRMSEERTSGDWWVYGVGRGFVLGALGWMAYRWWFFLGQRNLIVQFFDLNEWVLFDLVSPIFLILALCLATRFWQVASEMGPIRWSAVAVGLLMPIALFAAEVSPAFQRDHSRLGSDMAFVRGFVSEREATGGRYPSVYWPVNRPDLLWIDVKATSYFSILQTAGVMFNKDTAHEIERRCTLVSKFEMAQQRQETVFLDDGRKVGMENLFKVEFNCPAPTREDLLRLCREPGLDYVVIPQEFPGLYSATNGRVYVYECYKVLRSEW